MGAREGIRFGGHGGRGGGEPPRPTAICGSSRPQTSSAFRYAALARSLIHRACQIRQRCERLLPDSDRAGSGSGNASYDLNGDLCQMRALAPHIASAPNHRLISDCNTQTESTPPPNDCLRSPSGCFSPCLLVAQSCRSGMFAFPTLSGAKRTSASIAEQPRFYEYMP